jgi:hypothetical protein
MLSQWAQVQRAPLGFSFAPGGLLFPYHVGVAYELERRQLISATTPIGGCSAGAIVAAAVATGLSEEKVVTCLMNVAHAARRGIRLDVAVRRELQLSMDESAPALARRHRLTLGYLEVLPRPRAHVVTRWSSKEDLIDCICASCNVPLYFGHSPLAHVRGTWALDGVLAINPMRFGCPPLPAERVIACSAMPPPAANLWAFRAEDVIQPESAEMGWDDRTRLPVNMIEWLLSAALPASDDNLHNMIDLGKRHASVWVQRYAQ